MGKNQLYHAGTRHVKNLIFFVDSLTTNDTNDCSKLHFFVVFPVTEKKQSYGADKEIRVIMCRKVFRYLPNRL